MLPTKAFCVCRSWHEPQFDSCWPRGRRWRTRGNRFTHTLWCACTAAGDTLWTFDLSSFAVSSPTLSCDGDTLYVGCDAGWDFKTKTSFPAKFYALRTRDGTCLSGAPSGAANQRPGP